MNFSEGMRRSALLLGGIGASVGIFASYVELRSVLEQRSNQAKFEQLAASDAVQQERKSWHLALRYTPRQAIESLRALPENQQRNVISSLDPSEKQDLLAKLKCAPSELGTQSTTAAMENVTRGDWFAAHAPDDPYACIAEEGEPPASTVDSGGIKTIRWTKDLKVSSIETNDGQYLFPKPAQSIWIYVLIALFPILGFFIPWGAVRTIGWVGAGFLAKKEEVSSSHGR